MQLERARAEPLRMMALTARPADTASGMIATSVPTRLGPADELDGDLGGHAERALAADEAAP